MEELRDKNGLTLKEFLASYNPNKYKTPSVTADILIFAKDGETLQLLLIQRGGHPFITQWALPGGFAEEGERLCETAGRELEEETGLASLPLEALGFFSAPERDPRGWTMSEAYISFADKSILKPQAADDAANAAWFDVEYTENGDTADLVLRSNDTVLHAKLGISRSKTQFGTHTDVKILNSGLIAFDHAEIITHGILKLKASRCI